MTHSFRVSYGSYLLNGKKGNGNKNMRKVNIAYNIARNIHVIYNFLYFPDFSNGYTLCNQKQYFPKIFKSSDIFRGHWR